MLQRSDSPAPSCPEGGGNGIEPIQYLIVDVLGILDTEDQTTCAVEALMNGGYLESQVGGQLGEVHAGR